MNDAAYAVLVLLAEGGRWRVAELARAADLDIAAALAALAWLQHAGVPIRQAEDRAYSLAWPLELLRGAAVAHAARASGFAGNVVCLQSVDSTNAALLRNFQHRHALLAEYQSAGRGRRGRRWRAPPASGLLLSLGWRFDAGMRGVQPLSLAVAIGVAECLSRQPASVSVKLKWPNDLVVGGNKLGGILVEARGAASGACEVVIGVGINLRLPCAESGFTGFEPDQPWTDVWRLTGRMPARAALAGALIGALGQVCRELEQGPPAGLEGRWARFDALQGRWVRVEAADGRTLDGRATGVTPAGALRLVHNAGVAEFHTGEVSVRVR